MFLAWLFLYISTSYSNVVGVDFQNFNPTSNGLDFVTVQSSETLEPGIVNFGYFINYAVNTLPYFEDSQTAQSSYNDYLLSGDFNVGIGLGDNWDIGFHFPHLIDQGVKSRDPDHGEFINQGVTEIRLTTKYRFFGDQKSGLAAVLTTDFNQVKDNPYLGRNEGVVAIVELAGDITLGDWAVGANLGYRFREEGEQIDVDIEPYGNSFTASLAASYLFPSIDTKMIAEIYGAQPESGASNRTDREESSAELLLGLKKDWDTHLASHFGVTTELFNGTASPDYRIYAGLNWATGPHFFKKKKVVSKKIISENLPLIEDLPEVEDFEGGEVYKLTKVLFEFGSGFKAVGEAKKELDAMAERIKSKPYTQVVIAGHTDSVGGEDYNKKLSRKRAATVANYLIRKHKIPKRKMKIVGFGESLPIADNGNYQGRAKNRRVETIVMDVGEWQGYPADYGYHSEDDVVEEVEVDATKIPRTLPKKKIQN